MKEFVVVLGYGCDLTDDLKNYLQEVAKYVQKNLGNVIVVTSGGFTQKETKPEVSEAGMMMDYLVKSGVPWFRIVPETHSQSTIDNLFCTSLIFQRVSEGIDWRVVIFCDSIRKFKVKVEAKYFYKGDFEVIGIDFNRSLTEKLYQWFFATPVELLLFRMDNLRRFFSNYRSERNRKK